jgi:hypothetical protein
MRMRSLIVTCLVSLVSLGVIAASASAETTGPVWKIMSVSNPTNFKPGDHTGSDAIVVTATNVGGAAADGETSPITIGDVLPAGLSLAPETTDEVTGQTVLPIFGDNAYRNPVGKVSATGAEPLGFPYGLTCTTSPALSCTTSERVDPGDTLVITIRVDVSESPPLSPCPSPAEATSCVTDEASVSGGGAVSASVSDPVTISSALPEYGVAKGDLFAATSASQAGAHPNVTTDFFLNTINPRGESNGEDCSLHFAPICTLYSEPVGAPKDVRFDLPPGLVGTTVGVPRCTMAEVANEANCPRDTMIGTATLIVVNPSAGRLVVTVPVYNIAPAPGEPAAFAFNALFYSVRLDTSVLSDGEDNVRVTAPNITEGASDSMSSVTIWGVPAEHNGPGPDAAANGLGGNLYLEGKFEGKPQINFGGPGIEEHEGSGGAREKTVFEQRVPLLTNPSQCSEGLTAELSTDSWEAAGPGVFASEKAPMGTATGCGQLSFKPEVSMLPDTLEAGAPAGYSFNLGVPQNTDPESLATPDVKKTSVTLPLGTVISPSAANGLGVCSDEQFFGSGPPEARPATPGACPRDSQVGEVSIETPALEKPLTGDVYLASPECNPCSPGDAQNGRMIRLFVQVVGKGEDGIVVKLEGRGQIDQQTGQITTTFENTPQLPFSHFELTLQGGERATLANPRTCGEVTTTADLTPWSTPYTPDASPESKFAIDENCFGAQFNPSFTAGTTSNQAGGYSPFTLSFGRSDADQFLNGVQIQMPPGLLGMLSKVSLCGEAQANAGTCGPESQIGETTVETGPGADPFLVTGGKVYITGPYKGAPYGLSIVVPAVAGPYTLSGTTGNGTVVNRSAISVNPETSALTVTSDPLPTELDGIPLQLRLVNVTINRQGFTFNPTSCGNLRIGGTLTSTEAASAGESSSFQVTNCTALKFTPGFAVSTSGKTSKANGASLDAKVTYPKTEQGAQADIAKVKVDLPKQLPSRLTTLQKACLAAVFDANPANCPAASVIGTVRVNTPVLSVPLTGPVYFVSHGGEAFPSLTMVLQGDGVRVDLVGATFISKAGITSTTFKTVPDVPFSSFELYLPEGKYSALAANGNLCTSKLAMPTAFTAQNGAEIHESTKIAVTGCAKAKKATKKKKTKKKAKKAGSAQKSSHGQGGQS